ncbi:MAG: ARMT1-like domain-containing protein [Candidatus Aminicenantaceae bacterium]|jgi:uncharacterized protein with ATP-grasp and redox domains
MRAALECFPCYYSQILKTARMLSLTEEQTREAISRFSGLLPGLPDSATPAGIGRELYLILSKLSGDPDPYRGIKAHCTRLALDMYPKMKERVRSSRDPLKEALRIAVAGNFIDFGTTEQVNLKAGLEEILYQEFVIDHYEELRDHLDKVDEVLMLGDNAGETVFDRVLIEELGKPVRYVVREAPMINDAIREDAVMAGIDRVAEVISSGCVAPGTIRRFCSAEFWQTMQEAQLIISKGQGNFEGLSDEPLPIFFLLKAKCFAVAREIGVPQGSLLLLSPRGRPRKGHPA